MPLRLESRDEPGSFFGSEGQVSTPPSEPKDEDTRMILMSLMTCGWATGQRRVERRRLVVFYGLRHGVLVLPA